MSERGPDASGELDERVEQLNRIVSLFVDKLEAEFGLELGFEASDAAYMDVILTELQRSGRPLPASLYLAIGGYVGETLIRERGGRWLEGEEDLTVELDGAAHVQRVPVFSWVREAYADPHGHSLGRRFGGVGGEGVA